MLRGGCLFVHIIKSSLYTATPGPLTSGEGESGCGLGYQVSLVFQITQDIQDKELLEIIEKYLGFLRRPLSERDLK
jgi:hypothetical protein